MRRRKKKVSKTKEVLEPIRTDRSQVCDVMSLQCDFKICEPIRTDRSTRGVKSDPPPFGPKGAEFFHPRHPGQPKSTRVLSPFHCVSFFFARAVAPHTGALAAQPYICPSSRPPSSPSRLPPRRPRSDPRPLVVAMRPRRKRRASSTSCLVLVWINTPLSLSR